MLILKKLCRKDCVQKMKIWIKIHKHIFNLRGLLIKVTWQSSQFQRQIYNLPKFKCDTIKRLNSEYSDRIGLKWIELTATTFDFPLDRLKNFAIFSCNRLINFVIFFMKPMGKSPPPLLCDRQKNDVIFSATDWWILWYVPVVDWRTLHYYPCDKMMKFTIFVPCDWLSNFVIFSGQICKFGVFTSWQIDQVHFFFMPAEKFWNFYLQHTD